MKYTFLLVCAVLVVTSCSPKTKPQSSASASTSTVNPDVQRMQSKYPDFTNEQFLAGKSLYESNCGSCHRLEPVNAKDEAGWNKIVPPMVAKVNKKAGSEILDKDKQEAILRYLVTMATK
jgi:cytochrome c5